MNGSMDNDRNNRIAAYLLYLYAFASCISIAGTNGVLALLAVVFLVDWWNKKSAGDVRKDFSLFAIIYGWKGITLIANGLVTKLHRVRELWDKIPYLVIGRCRISENQLNSTLHVLFITNSLLVIYAIGQKVFHLPAIYQALFDGSRMIGYFGNSMHYSGYIAIVLVLSLCLALFYRAGFAIYVPFLVAGLLMGGSRIYIFAVIVCVFLISLIKSKKAFMGASILVLVIIVTIVNLWPALPARFSSAFDASGSSSWKVRQAYWPVAWKAYKEHPLFGVGYHEFSNYLKPFAEAGIVRHPAHAHNLYLQELVEGGPVGFLLMVVTMIYFTRKYYLFFKASANKLLSGMSLGVSISFLILIIAGTAEYNFGAAVLWLLLTFLMGICEAYKNGLNNAALQGSIADASADRRL